MNKKIKAIIEFAKEHKKQGIGLAVALGVAVTGIAGYAISKNLDNKNSTSKNNNVLAEAKENEENKKIEGTEEENNEIKEDDENTVTTDTQEEGKTEESKETNPVSEESSNVNIDSSNKTTDNKVNTSSNNGNKVDKVETGKEVNGTGTVTIKPTKPNGNTPVTPPTEENKPTKPTVKPEEPKPVPPVTPPTTVKPEKPTPPPVEPEKPKRTWEYQSAMSNELWSLFNAYRKEQGLNSLTLSSKYAGWTKQHAEEMAQKENGFHKTYPEGGQIVFDGNAYKTASGFLQAFKNSPQHNKNMLDDELTEGACAIYKDSNGQFYVVIGFDY